MREHLRGLFLVGLIVVLLVIAGGAAYVVHDATHPRLGSVTDGR